MTEVEEKTYPIDEVLQKKPWSVPDAYRYCVRLARNHYENFPVGSMMIPKKLQPHVCAVYAFARRADDIADEDFLEPDRIPALNAWLELLNRSLRGRVNHPVFLALKETIQEYSLDPQLFVDLVTAFKMDVETKRHPTFEDVLDYCRHSANPVGRLVLLLFGYRDEGLMKLSDKICTALQLANFWQDVSVDLKKNRIYIPQEDIPKFNYTEEQLFSFDHGPQFRELLKFQVDRTDQMFREGAPLVHHLHGRLALEIKCTVLGGMKILDMVRTLDYNSLSVRPVLKSRDKLSIFFKSLFGYGRATRPLPVQEVQPL
ncbi:MAG: squalene synthase HpnC [bacterium]|nr:squalene synthase HpnC [bacterium]